MRNWRVSGAALLAACWLAAPAQAENVGQKLYDKTCAACHGAAAVGGFAPPLVNAPLWKSLGDRAPQYFAQVVAAGISGPLEVQGQSYRGLIMPPQSGVPAQDLSLIINYVLKDINGVEALTTEESVQAALKAPMAHSAIRELRKAGAL